MNKQQRTQNLIDYYRDLPGEASMLKGILCMSHAFEGKEQDRLYDIFDTLMIAARMDEIMFGVEA